MVAFIGLGSARGSRAGFGGSPKRISVRLNDNRALDSRRRAAFGRTRAACAPQRKKSCSRRDPSAEIENSHSDREAVCHLIKNYASRAISDVAIDFDAA